MWRQFKRRWIMNAPFISIKVIISKFSQSNLCITMNELISSFRGRVGNSKPRPWKNWLRSSFMELSWCVHFIAAPWVSYCIILSCIILVMAVMSISHFYIQYRIRDDFKVNHLQHTLYSLPTGITVWLVVRCIFVAGVFCGFSVNNKTTKQNARAEQLNTVLYSTYSNFSTCALISDF